MQGTRGHYLNHIMNFYITKKTDVLTPAQREQYNRIKQVVDDHDELVSDIWDNLDHDVTDTLPCGTESSNFESDLIDFIFGWVMGEKMNDIQNKLDQFSSAADNPTDS